MGRICPLWTSYHAALTRTCCANLIGAICPFRAISEEPRDVPPGSLSRATSFPECGDRGIVTVFTMEKRQTMNGTAGQSKPESCRPSVKIGQLYTRLAHASMRSTARPIPCSFRISTPTSAARALTSSVRATRIAAASLSPVIFLCGIGSGPTPS